MDPLTALLVKKYGFSEDSAKAYAAQVRSGRATSSKALQSEAAKTVADEQMRRMDEMRKYAAASALRTRAQEKPETLNADDLEALNANDAYLNQTDTNQRAAMQADATRGAGAEKALAASKELGARSVGLGMKYSQARAGAASALDIGDNLQDYATSLTRTGPGRAETEFGYTPDFSRLTHEPTAFVSPGLAPAAKPGIDMTVDSVTPVPPVSTLELLDQLRRRQARGGGAGR